MIRFPDARLAPKSSCAVYSDSIHAEMLLAAYSQGFFPWTDDPVGWFSPDPRAVFLDNKAILPSNLHKLWKKAQFTITLDNNFQQVIESCAQVHAKDGVWITKHFINAYCDLHAMGYAHSVEVWQHGVLVGGLYGVQLGQMFAGESMFHTVTNASKVAFQVLLQQLRNQGTTLLDAQVINHHTQQLGAQLIPRNDFLKRLQAATHGCFAQAGKRWPAYDLI